jgi:hypothetical protein
MIRRLGRTASLTFLTHFTRLGSPRPVPPSTPAPNECTTGRTGDGQAALHRNPSWVLAFLFPRKSPELAMYPWPIGNFDYGMDDALHIALDYLDRTGQAGMFQEVQSGAENAILAAWKAGVRHRIKLADIAIKAVERKAGPILEYKRGDNEISRR